MMKISWLVVLLTAGIALAQDKPAVDQLAWLAGCWDGSNSRKESREQWMKPSGNMMLGMSRTVRPGGATEFEFMRIHENQGEVYFTAKPSGQPEASFKLARVNNNEAVFENPTHDFPQRVVYRLEKDGSLLAWIEGKNAGKERRIEFPMKRVKCE